MQNQNSINQKQLLSYKSLPGGYNTLNKIKYNCCCSGLEPHLVKGVTWLLSTNLAQMGEDRPKHG